LAVTPWVAARPGRNAHQVIKIDAQARDVEFFATSRCAASGTGANVAQFGLNSNLPHGKWTATPVPLRSADMAADAFAGSEWITSTRKVKAARAANIYSKGLRVMVTANCSMGFGTGKSAPMPQPSRLATSVGARLALSMVITTTHGCANTRWRTCSTGLPLRLPSATSFLVFHVGNYARGEPSRRSPTRICGPAGASPRAPRWAVCCRWPVVDGNGLRRSMR
jgi:hypothetical protein